MEFRIGAAARAAGYRLVAFPEVGSTNAEALNAARGGDPGKAWFATSHQTAGRGRRGRAWVTPSGNLAASLLLVVDFDPGTAASLGFVAGLALDEALRDVAPALAVRIAMDGIEPGQGGEGDRLRLKWPNDLLFDGAKLAGILLEGEMLPDGRFAVVIGIGVNVVEAPQGLPYPAVALNQLGAPVDAAGLFLALSDAWASVERIWAGGRGFAAIRRLWLERAAGIGESVAVRLGDRVVSGIFETIDETGRLVVRLPDGQSRTIAAGEVHFGAVASNRI
jgi:BirA family transcriptional regulator, biotin operon repressor / biotin---[acetyl-CoA-carboxylase] ligase